MALSEPIYDVIIVGGGPAGSSCATFLGRKGHNVLLLEKATFPRDKTCGDAISGKSISVLKKLGLVDKIESQPHGKVYGVLFSSPKGDIFQVELPKKGDEERGYGYDVKRLVFDNTVFQLAKSTENVKVVENFTVTDLIFDGGYIVGVKGKHNETNQEKEFHSRVVVGADGANSVVAKKLGLSQIDPEHYCLALRAYYDGVEGMTGKIEIHFIDEVLPGYFWIFPLEGKKANIGVGMVLKEMRTHNTNLQDALKKALESPMFKKRFKAAKLEGPVKGWQLPFASKRVKNYGNGFVLLGDASSLIDPFTGEGVGNSLKSGEIASEVIDEGLRQDTVSEEFFKQYYDRLWTEIGQEIDTSYKLQKIGRHKFLLNTLIAKASRSPKVAEWISESLLNEEAKKELTSPLFYLKLLFA